MTDNPCNCSTCPYKKDYSCKFGIADMTAGFTKVTGCFYHPQAREYLMAPVIEELDRLKFESGTSEWRDGFNAGIRARITLIKEGVKK
jgi:hypothetical protein